MADCDIYKDVLHCEHWTFDENCGLSDAEIDDLCGCGDTVTTAENIQKMLADPKMAWELKGMKKCCDLHGTWVEVMTKYHEHMGWEPYTPPL